MRRPPNQEWFYRWRPQTFLSPTHLFWLSLLVAWGDTCTGSQYVPLPEGLLCLPAQSQEYGGDSRRQAVTLGELDRAVDGPEPISRTGICSFVQMSTARALQNDLQQVRMSLTKYSETDFMRVAWGATSSSGPCAHCPALWSSIGICHWTPELAGPPLAPCAFHRWEQVPLSTWHVNGSGEAVENNMTGLVLGQWWSGEAYPWRDAQTSTG